MFDRNSIRRKLGLGGLLLSVLSINTASAENGVTVMSVNDYGPTDQLPNSIANGNGFMNKITQNGIFAFRRHWTDNDVQNAFFLDPDRTGNSSHVDMQAFDSPDSVISYFTGHGDGAIGNQGGGLGEPCTLSSQCTNPAPGIPSPGKCIFGTNQSSGRCLYQASRSLFTYSDANPGGKAGSGKVQYNNFQVAFGESVFGTRGPFAGTDGGANLVVLDISFGTLFPWKFNELPPAMAGVHLAAAVMPVEGDTNNSAARGAAFADQFDVNPNSAVSDAWLQVINILSNDGNACADGGFGGINGCGANFIISNGVSSADARNRIMFEQWVQLTDNTIDSSGDFLFGRWMCNYDCVNQFPPLHD